MRKRLWKIADEPFRVRVILFRKQAHVVAEPQQALKEGSSFIVASLQREIVR